MSGPMRRVHRYTREELETHLERERRRLSELETRGSAALSRYDVEIAHQGNAEQALATARWLTRNHIAYFSGLLHRLDAQGRQLGLFEERPS